jgi:membrane protease YdiL (CAAX protease family)
MESPAGAEVAAVAMIEPPPPSPFARLRVRELVGLFVLFAAATLVITVLLTSRSRGNPDPRLLLVLLTGAMALPVLLRAHQTRLSWKRLFGAPFEKSDLPLTMAVVPVALLTMASAFLIYAPLSYVAPEFVRRQLLDDSVFDANTVGQWVVLAFGAAVLAPIVEELVFRGIILQRWAYRWGTRTGVIASSALFAVGHGEWFGHFLFGMLMALLYLRTRRLWVPIVAHGINNLVLTLPILWGILAHLPEEPPETIASLRSHAWIGAPTLAVGLLLGWLYLRSLWPTGSVRAALAGAVPYEAMELSSRTR